MRRLVRALIAAAAVCSAGCGAARSGGDVRGNEYVNAAAHFSFRVPSGWEDATSRNPFRRTSTLVRFQSPAEDAAVSVTRVDVGARGCEEAIAAASGRTFRKTEGFPVTTPEGGIPAWRGSFDDGERRGEVRGFCSGKDAVVLEAAADKGAYASRKKDLASVLASFRFLGSEPVAIVKAKPPEPPAAVFVHRVTFRGQTLGQIANWYTGKYGNWKALTAVNEGLTVPNAALRVGREVKIPLELVVRRTPMSPPKTAKRVPPKAGAAPKAPEEGGPPAKADDEFGAEEAAPAVAEAEPAAEAPVAEAPAAEAPSEAPEAEAPADEAPPAIIGPK